MLQCTAPPNGIMRPLKTVTSRASPGARVGHFRKTHDHLGRRSFLREQVIVNANDRSIPNDPAVRQSCARFEKIRTGKGFVCWWNATNVASCFGIGAGGLEGAAA